MVKIRSLMEDAFKQKVQDTFNSRIKGKVEFKLSDFDRDALELGVMHELQCGHDFTQALYRAMWRLSKDPHRYDKIDDYGHDGEDRLMTNQITWTGSPGITRG